MQKEIIKLFSYSNEEREAFGYIKKYSVEVDKYLTEIITDEEKLKKFMLAGLFLTYRACSHQGENMTTNTELLSLKNDHKTRLNTFYKSTGIEIISTKDYLKKINFNPIKGIFGIDKFLLKFVLK